MNWQLTFSCLLVLAMAAVLTGHLALGFRVGVPRSVLADFAIFYAVIVVRAAALLGVGLS